MENKKKRCLANYVLLQPPAVIFVGYSAEKNLKTDQTPKTGFLPTQFTSCPVLQTEIGLGSL